MFHFGGLFLQFRAAQLGDGGLVVLAPLVPCVEHGPAGHHDGIMPFAGLVSSRTNSTSTGRAEQCKVGPPNVMFVYNPYNVGKTIINHPFRNTYLW